MKEDKFQEVVEMVIKNINTVMGQKSESYARGGDKLHNFKRASRVAEVTPAQALLGMKLKHDVSILDMIDDIELRNGYATDEYMLEKFGDSINYSILLMALLIDMRKKP